MTLGSALGARFEDAGQNRQHFAHLERLAHPGAHLRRQLFGHAASDATDQDHGDAGVTRAQVYECLAYYEDHRTEIDALIIEQMRDAGA